MEAGIDGADADGGSAQGAFKRAVDAAAESLEAFAGVGEGLAGIVTEDGGGEFGDAVLALAKLGCEGGFSAEAVVVETLGLAMEKRGDARLGAADGQWQSVEAERTQRAGRAATAGQGQLVDQVASTILDPSNGA